MVARDCVPLMDAFLARCSCSRFVSHEAVKAELFEAGEAAEGFPGLVVMTQAQVAAAAVVE